PLYPQVIPGETYFVHAKLNQSVTTGAGIELMFDVPEGYRLFVDGFERNHLREVISSEKTWPFVLERENADYSPDPGSHRGPYFGDNYLLDVSLGTMPEGFAAGILRIDREAFLDSDRWDRSLIHIR